MEPQLVNNPGSKALPGNIRAAGNYDIQVAGYLPRQGQSPGCAFAEFERSWPPDQSFGGPVSHDETWFAERAIISPATDADIEHATANDDRPGSLEHSSCGVTISVRGSPGLETKPMMEPVPGIAERKLDRDAISGDITIQRRTHINDYATHFSISTCVEAFGRPGTLAWNHRHRGLPDRPSDRRRARPASCSSPPCAHLSS